MLPRSPLTSRRSTPLTAGGIALAAALLALPGCASERSVGPQVPVSDATATIAGTVTSADAGPDTAERLGSTAFTSRALPNDRYELFYTDVAGDERRIEVRVRRPGSTDDSPPVVVWSHGGTDGKDSSVKVGQHWDRSFTDAGIAFVAVAHPGRDQASRDRLCAAVGAVECAVFQYTRWDRPHDAAVVYDWLAQRVADGSERFDLNRLGYAGHSAGTYSVLTHAGMVSTLDSEVVPRADSRPVAFMVTGPPGTERQGLETSDFTAIDRPLLMATGTGDNTDGNVGTDRRTTFGLLPAGDRFLLWVDDEAATHTMFDLDIDSCQRTGATKAHCTELAKGIAATAVAFFSAVFDGTSPAVSLAELGPSLPGSMSITRRDP